jgi:hypothetical protein
MTLGELRQLLATEPPVSDNLEVKVWLPGSTLSLSHNGSMILRGDVLMIEGNIDPGSLLHELLEKP